MMRNTMQVFLLARTRSLVIAMCSQQEPRRGSVVVSISFLHNHNRPSPRLDAIQCSCHQAALNRFAIFACMVFRTMRHLRCLWLQFFAWLEFVVVSHTHLLKYMPNPLLTGLWTARCQKSESQKHEVIAIRVIRAAPSAPSFRFATAPEPHTVQKKAASSARYG